MTGITGYNWSWQSTALARTSDRHDMLNGFQLRSEMELWFRGDVDKRGAHTTTGA